MNTDENLSVLPPAFGILPSPNTHSGANPSLSASVVLLFATYCKFLTLISRLVLLYSLDNWFFKIEVSKAEAKEYAQQLLL